MVCPYQVLAVLHSLMYSEPSIYVLVSVLVSASSSSAHAALGLVYDMHVRFADLDLHGEFEGVEVHQLLGPLSHGWLDPGQCSVATQIPQDIKASSQRRAA